MEQGDKMKHMENDYKINQQQIQPGIKGFMANTLVQLPTRKPIVKHVGQTTLACQNCPSLQTELNCNQCNQWNQ